MAKHRDPYVCTHCGHEQSRWVGLCPSCGEGGTLQEQPRLHGGASGRAQPASFSAYSKVSTSGVQRVSTGISEFDRVLGGGLVPGACLLLSGDPGAGKTTIASATAMELSRAGRKVGYVSGEETESQIKLRFERMGAGSEDGLFLSNDVNAQQICSAMESEDFSLVIIDSIQSLSSPEASGTPGSVMQVRECSHLLIDAAMRTGTTVLMIGQIVSSGDIAGPKMLEHDVDAVLAFESGEDLRLLRAKKNRFGSIDEVGVFEMTDKGIVGVEDTSALFVDEGERLPGSAITTVMEGSRPVLCEVQALVSVSNLAQPIRAVRGLDQKRAQMLLAVLSRKAGIHLGSLDVYVNVSGGLKIDDPGTDLAVCLAVASATEGAPLKDKICAFGEVSLLGLAKKARMSDRRSKESERLGYKPLSVDRPSNIGEIIEQSLGSARTEASLAAG